MKSNYYFAAFILTLISNMVFAHNAQLASYKMSVDGEKSFLYITFSTYGAEQALLKANPKLDLESENLVEFKQALIAHIKNNTWLSMNGQELSLGRGAIKLGSHESKVMLKIENLPKNPTSLNVKVACFNENERQINIFKVDYGNVSARKQLDKSNEYEGTFAFVKP